MFKTRRRWSFYVWNVGIDELVSVNAKEKNSVSWNLLYVEGHISSSVENQR